MALEPKTLRRVFKGLLVVLSAAETVWLYSILIFLILNIISFQVKRLSTSASSRDELFELIWWAAQLVSIIVLRIATAYYAYFRNHVPSFILIWAFDAVILLITLILMPSEAGVSQGALNTGIIVLTRFSLEILLSVFLLFLQVSEIANDDPVDLLNQQMHPMAQPHPALIVRRVFVHRI